MEEILQRQIVFFLYYALNTSRFPFLIYFQRTGENCLSDVQNTFVIMPLVKAFQN